MIFVYSIIWKYITPDRWLTEWLTHQQDVVEQAQRRPFTNKQKNV